MQRILNWVCGIALPLLMGGVCAQNYPAKPVHLVVPYAPGGGVDIMARLVAGKLSERLGVQVIVENRAGAGTIIGTDAVARAAADGYTLLIANPALAANPALNKKLPYDSAKSLAPVILIAESYNALVVHPSLPVNSVKGLVEMAKARPGELNYASAGLGSAIYLAMALFEDITGVKLVHIPYKGAGPALTDVVGGQVPIMFIATPPAVGYIKSGRLRALGVSSGHRLAILPNVPTIAEAGFPKYVLSNWYGVVVPAKTPPEIASKLNAEINAVLEMPEVKVRISGLGAEPAGGTPQQFGERLAGDTAIWARVLGKAN